MTPYQQSKMDYLLTGHITDPYHAFVEIQKSVIIDYRINGPGLSPYIKHLNKKQKMLVHDLLQEQKKIQDLRFIANTHVATSSEIIGTILQWSRASTAAFKDNGIDITVEILFKCKSTQELDTGVKCIYTAPSGRRYIVVVLDSGVSAPVLFEHSFIKSHDSTQFTVRIGMFSDFVTLPFDLTLYRYRAGKDIDIEKIIKNWRAKWIKEYWENRHIPNPSLTSQSSAIRQIASMRSTIFNPSNYTETLAMRSLLLLKKGKKK